MAKEKAKPKAKTVVKSTKDDSKKNDAQQAADSNTTKQSETLEVKPNLDAPAVQKAIKEGLALIKDGKSKADAAWAIFGQLKDANKELIVAAFVKGATLTEKGALTYWYNCRRKASK